METKTLGLCHPVFFLSSAYGTADKNFLSDLKISYLT